MRKHLDISSLLIDTLIRAESRREGSSAEEYATRFIETLENSPADYREVNKVYNYMRSLSGLPPIDKHDVNPPDQLTIAAIKKELGYYWKD